ncbi:MAG: uracil phosphoribosyltransferase [Eubacteriales bacterium]|jgi:uracil phosphoribosyltransferase|nr:uracil phosphoribosyltransferase [Eubacteriales bacterium]MDD3571499.1 uracil phosphoribosyltransferase [Eubacteriales bacterium]MDD4134298.1 uracil phosphoribosyltransferase [Eubacteriales bacterium]NLO13946.1 uracil phosphoribosyltransferase [Clostridiales bacterium]
MHENVFIFEHPLIQHKVSLLRDKTTSMKDFRDLLDELSMLMVYEITKDFPLVEVEIETPMARAKTKVLSDRKVSLVPILRAGIGMVHGIQQLLPNARVGHIGLYRDHETCQPVEYYCKLPPDIAESTVIMLDPMFATGGSISAALKILKDRGCEDIRLVCIVAARAGVERICQEHPDVKIYCAAFDEVLNPNAYIVPGLGDAGDRLFGTK